MYCKICGKVVPDGTDYCSSCAEPIPSVTFAEAIKLFFSNYTNFQGRARRSEYWMASLFTGIVSGVLSYVLPMLSGIWALLIFLPSLAISIRRLHDIGKSGWAYLVCFIPLVGSIILLVWCCTDSKEENQWGPNPKFRVVRGGAASWKSPAAKVQPVIEPNPTPIALPSVVTGSQSTKPAEDEFPLTAVPTSAQQMPDSFALPKAAERTVPSFSVTLILCTGPSAGKQLTFQGGQQAVFGRNQPGYHNTILASYDKVSGTHCRIDVTGSGMTITDLGSTNGTIVNGQKLMPNIPAPVPHGGVIFLADNNCVFQVKHNK